jgi:hypothetical protein
MAVVGYSVIRYIRRFGSEFCWGLHSRCPVSIHGGDTKGNARDSLIVINFALLRDGSQKIARLRELR